MRGRSGSRGRGASKGRGASVSALAPPFHTEAEHPSRDSHYNFKQLGTSPHVRYETSPTQIPRPPHGNPMPFMLTPALRGVGGQPRANRDFETHPQTHVDPIYERDDAGASVLGSKLPYDPSSKEKRGSMMFPPYGIVPMQEQNQRVNYQKMLPHGMMPPMMMGGMVPMIPMGRPPDHNDRFTSTSQPSHVAQPAPTRDRRSISPRRRETANASTDLSVRRKSAALENMVDHMALSGRAEAYSKLYVKLQNGLRRIKIAVPSIFRLRNNFKLKSEEEGMLAAVEEVWRYLLVVHLQKEQNMQFPLELSKVKGDFSDIQESLTAFVGSSSNLAVVNVNELLAELENHKLHYNGEWFALRWLDDSGDGSATRVASRTPYYIRNFSLESLNITDKLKRAVFLRGITVAMMQEHLESIIELCHSGRSAKEATLRVLGYYALWCDDDPFITFASSVLPELESNLQLQFYMEMASFLDSSRYRMAKVYMERYVERILPMCLSLQEPKAWSSTIKLLMKSIEPLRLGIKNSGLAVSLLRTLKSWCNVFMNSEETCVEVFSKCIQLVLQAGDDSRIVVRASAADLAVHIWLNNKGKLAIVDKLGYDTVRTLGCISGVQAIKFNIWSGLLSPEEIGDNDMTRQGMSLPDQFLCKMDTYDTVYQYLQQDEAEFVTSMLQAHPTVLCHLMNWYLLRYCKITKTVLALEKIANVIRFALMTYPKFSKEDVPHASSNLAVLCCWMLNVSISCSVGSGCLDLANVKMALFVDWLFFNYEYNSRIVKLCLGSEATFQCNTALQGLGQCQRIFIKELSKCIYIMRRPDLVNDEEHMRQITILLGTNEVMGFAYVTARDTFRRLLDYLLNAVLHYYSDVGVVAIDVISAIFVVSVLELNQRGYTLASLLTAIKGTMLGKICSVLDISLDSISVHAEDAETKQARQLLQLKSSLEPINGSYTAVVALEEKHKSQCYDEVLKAIVLRCYGMILEYMINLESFNSMYHENHLTTDTLRANRELVLLKQMKCPKLYTNVEALHLEEEDQENETDNTCSDITSADESTNNQESELFYELSDVSSEEEENTEQLNGTDYKDPSTEGDAPVAPEGVPYSDGGAADDIGNKQDSESINPFITLHLQSFQLKQLLQAFVHGSLNNPAMSITDDPLYIYMKNCLKVDSEPDYTIALEHMDGSTSTEFVFVPLGLGQEGTAKWYRVALVIDLVTAYLLETAMQWLFDDANGTGNVDNILFRDWIVHVFNAFVRLLASLCMAGHREILWELIYYVAAVSIAISKESISMESETTLQKKELIAVTLLFNMITAVAEREQMEPEELMQRTLSNVVKRSVRGTGRNLDVILQKFMPVRLAMEAVFTKEYQYFGKMSSMLCLLIKVMPASALSELVKSEHIVQFNLFTSDLDDSTLTAHVGAMLNPCGKDPLHRRKHLISWQLVCRMYEAAFGNEEIRAVANRGPGFLQIRSEQDAPQRLAKLPYLTDHDISGEEQTEDKVLCFLGASNTKRANYMAYQKGYTFSKALLSSDQLHVLSGAVLDCFKEGDSSTMQISLFSSFPIFVHSVPTQQTIHDIEGSLSFVLPQRSKHENGRTQFIAEMLIALLVHWLSRYPRFLESLTTDGPVLSEAMGQMMLKYAIGRDMVFAFNGTTIKVHLENAMLLKLAL